MLVCNNNNNNDERDERRNRKQLYKLSFSSWPKAWQEKTLSVMSNLSEKKELIDDHIIDLWSNFLILRVAQMRRINSSIVNRWAFRQVNNHRVVYRRVYDRFAEEISSYRCQPDEHRVVSIRYTRTFPVRSLSLLLWLMLLSSSLNSMLVLKDDDPLCIRIRHWWFSPELLRLNSTLSRLGHLNGRRKRWVMWTSLRSIINGKINKTRTLWRIWV